MAETAGTDLVVTVLSEAGARTVLRLAGELDHCTAPLLAAALATASGAAGGPVTEVVLDLARLEFLGAAGLRVIAAAAASLAGTGGVLTVRSPSPTVRGMLTATSLHQVLRVEPAALGEPAAPGAGPDARPVALVPAACGTAS